MSHDTVIHRLVRPAVRSAASTGVTPNHLTFLRLATGLAAAAGFSRGGVLWPDLGAVVLLISFLLDRADGELARWTGQTSQGGYRLDLICDCIATAAAFVGMGVGARNALGPASGLIGVVAAVSVSLVYWQINVVKIMPARGLSDRRGRTLFDPDDAMLATPFMVWLGWMPWVVAVAAAATPLVSGAIALLAARRALRPAAAHRQA